MNRRDFIKIIGITGAYSFLAGTMAPNRIAGASPISTINDLRGPFDLAFDDTGNLYVTDPAGYRFIRLDKTNYAPEQAFGGPGSKPGYLNFPKGICHHNGELFVIDSNNCRIQVFDLNGNLSRIIGSVGSTGGTFSTPQGIFITPDGTLYISDTRNHRIQIMQNGLVVAVIGDLGDGQDQFRLPTACVVNGSGDIFVLDSKHGVIKVFDKDLNFRRQFGNPGREPGMLNLPQGMALDKDQNLWIADTGNDRIQKFSSAGEFITIFGGPGKGPGQFRSPTSVVFKGDAVYVADNGNGRIQVIKPA